MASQQNDDPDSTSATSYPTIQGAGSSAKVLYTLGSDPPPRPPELSDDGVNINDQQPQTATSSTFRNVMRKSPTGPSSWRKRRKAPEPLITHSRSFSNFHDQQPQQLQKQQQHYQHQPQQQQPPPPPPLKSQVDLILDDDQQSQHSYSRSHSHSHSHSNSHSQSRAATPSFGSELRPSASASSLTVDRYDLSEPRTSDFPMPRPSREELENIVPWLYDDPTGQSQHGSAQNMAPSSSSTSSRRHLKPARSLQSMGKLKEASKQHASDKVPWIKRLVHRANTSNNEPKSSKPPSDVPSTPPSPAASLSDTSKRHRFLHSSDSGGGRSRSRRYPSDGSTNMDIALDTDLSQMDGIVNPSYLPSSNYTFPNRHKRTPSGHSLPSRSGYGKPNTDLASNSYNNRSMDESALQQPSSTSKNSALHGIFHSHHSHHPHAHQHPHLYQRTPRSGATSSKSSSSRKGSAGSDFPVIPPILDQGMMYSPDQASTSFNQKFTHANVHSDWSAPESWSLPPKHFPGDTGGSDTEEEDYEFPSRNDSLSEFSFDDGPINTNVTDGDSSRRPSEAVSYGKSSFTSLKKSSVTNHSIRICKPDHTHTTLLCPLTITTLEILAMLNSKPTFATAKGTGHLFVRERGLERELRPSERPLAIQKRRLEQAGYRPNDHLEEIERQDNSYLYMFMFRTEPVPVAGLNEESSGSKSYATIDLSSRGIATIPIRLYRHAHEIIVLNISRNFHLELPKDFAQACVSLRDLRITDANLRKIPSNIIHFPNLTVLDISQNRINDLGHYPLDQAKALTTLKLYANRLSHLPPYFANFQTLKYLDISNNKFDHIPDVIFQLPALVDLDLSFNHLSRIPNEFSKLIKLERFLCVGNSISELPDHIDSLKSLRVVDLRHNNILDVTPFSQLPRLEVLKCDNNTISSLDVHFEKLSSFEARFNPISSLNLNNRISTIKALNLSNAKLSTFKEDIFNSLQSLESLILDHNSIRSLDESLGQLPNLKRLSVRNNGLGSLPESIGNIKTLMYLDVSGNNINSLPSTIWQLECLVSLNASSNLLRDFPTIPEHLASSINSSSNASSSENASTVQQQSPTTINGNTKTYNNNNTSLSELTAMRPNSILDDISFFGSTTSFLDNKFYTPLSKSLQFLFLADNSLTDDSYQLLSFLSSLTILNLSFNDLYELPSQFLTRIPHLQQLYLSGNKLTTLPDDAFECIPNLEVLFLNANKLQTLPTEIGHLRKLKILDVGSNALKYNIANYRFDWNWNSNPELVYLNLSGNKRLEIKPAQPIQPPQPPQLGGGAAYMRQRKNLADFDSLHKIRVLGLMDVTLTNSSIPDGTDDRRVRTSLSDVNDMAYGIADSLPRKAEYANVIDLVVPRFRGKANEAILGLFDVPLWTSAGSGRGGSRIAMYLQDCFAATLTQELSRLTEGEDGTDAFRRAFLNVNREYGNILFPSFDARRKDSDLVMDRHKQISSISDDIKAGATGVVIYVVDKRLYVANAGDALAVISRRGGAAENCTTKHEPLSPQGIAQVRASDGFLTPAGAINNEVDVARAFGHYHVFPVVNACPDVHVYDLNASDEFIILGNRGLWDYVNEQNAVDVARSERADPMIAAQKLRDLALAYGCKSHIMVMILSIGDLFQEKTPWQRHGKGSLESSTDLEAYMAQKATRRNMAPGERYLTMLDREVAPPTGLLAIVFTDIRNSTVFWENNPGMHNAMRMHNQLLRRQLRAIGGYEVKTEGDSFMCSFPTVLSALLWCFTVQVELVSLDWPKAILDSEEGKAEYGANGEMLYRGLSVRMGIHWGRPVCEPDPITRRMDYFGPMVNRTSRISAVADGGQIAASADATNLIKKLLDENTDAVAGEAGGGGTGGLGVAGDEGGLAGGSSSSSVSSRRLTPALQEEVKNIRQFGLEIFDLGEKKLKGLETREPVSLLYPTRLAERHTLKIGGRSGENQTAKPTEIYEPTPQLLDPIQIRQLGTLCLRLESISSIITKRKLIGGQNNGSNGNGSSNHDTPHASVGGGKNDNDDTQVNGTPTSGTATNNNNNNNNDSTVFGILHPHLSKEHYPVSLSSSDADMIAFLEGMIIRIENTVSTLVLHQLGPYTEVLSALSQQARIDPGQLMKAVSIFSGLEQMLNSNNYDDYNENDEDNNYS